MRYIGSKKNLLNDIDSVIEKFVPHEAFSLCDIFSGTGSVGVFFKRKYRIISNDFLYFSYVIQSAKIENNIYPTFEKLYPIIGEDPIDYLNRSEPIDIDLNKCFIRNNYSSFCGTNYLTESNALKIDFWRLTIEKWNNNGLLQKNEYNYLVACVVETVPFYSNISGTYGAYLKIWDKRALKEIQLVRLEVENNGLENISFNEDSDILITKIFGDILYIDPPYNERQYLPNYHLLETIARYDYPEIKGTTGVRNYSSQKSKWCRKSTAYHALENMVRNAKFKYIILSYNTDGIMEVDEIEKILKKYAIDGTYHLTEVSYSRFKSRELVNKSPLKELLFFIAKQI